MKIKSLLITAIGGDIAQSVAHIIRNKYPHIQLYGTDIQNRHAGALFVDHYEIIPKANSTDYLNILKKIICQFDIDVILPMSESELTIFANLELTIEHCHIIHCGQKALEIGLDKFKTNQFLQNINIPSPWTKLISQGLPDNLPCILKPRIGSGSKSVFIVKDEMDVAYFEKKYPDYIYQELLCPKNQEITCVIYRTKTGNVYVLQLLRQLVGGTTSWAKVIFNQEIQVVCIKIANELNVIGSINIQLINTALGPRIFEINPRFSSTLAMRNAICFSDVIWTIDELENKKISQPIIQKNKIIHKITQVKIE